MDLLQVYDGDEVSLSEVLDRREARAARQRVLLQTSAAACLVSFTMNIPGPVKLFPLASLAFREGLRQIMRQLSFGGVTVTHEEMLFEKTGCEAMLCCSKAPERVKALVLRIEDAHPLGRLFDIDVLDCAGQKQDRKKVGFPARRCLVCDGPAQVCARARAHGLDELRRRAGGILWEYFCASYENRVLFCVQRAVFYEVTVTPKPGLVDRANCGVHRDMDIFTFLDSGAALLPYWRRFIRAGIGAAKRPPGELLPDLRFLGREAEEAMLRATGGVNTHKGLVFSMGLLCAALGMLTAGGVRSA